MSERTSGAFVAHELPDSKVVIFKIYTSFYKMPTVYDMSTVICCLCTGHYLMSCRKLAFLKMVAGVNTPCVSCHTPVSQESEPPSDSNLGCLCQEPHCQIIPPCSLQCVTSAPPLLFSSTQGVPPRRVTWWPFLPRWQPLVLKRLGMFP